MNLPIGHLIRIAMQAPRLARDCIAGIVHKSLLAPMEYHLGDDCHASTIKQIDMKITHMCNLRCRMCYEWGETGHQRQVDRGKPAVLPLDAVENLFDDCRGERTFYSLFGGEPLLHPAAVDLIGRIKAKGMHCLIITNGFLVKNLAERLVASGLDELNVSLDGDRDLHDDIRGMPGLFDAIMAGLQAVHEIKKRGRRKKPLVNLQCTITKYNYEHLEEMTRVAAAAGADSLTFHNLIFLDTTVLERQRSHDAELGCSSADWKGFVFEPGIDVDLLWQKMSEIRAGRYPFSVDFYPNFTHAELKEYYGNPGYAPAGTTGACMSPWIVGYVFPDGEVRPCLNSTYSYGNVKNAPFRAIWNSDKAVAYRHHLKKVRAFPVCARCTELYRY